MTFITPLLIILFHMVSPGFSALTKNQFRQCVQNSNAKKADVDLIQRKYLPESLESKCLLSCILDVEGVMRNGVYNSVVGRKIGQKAYPRNKAKSLKAVQILQDCGKRITTKDPCEAAFQLAQCTTTLSQNYKL